jgi:uncharacterized BrkB/YihY/UPF0761 family membrane protein
VQPIFYYLTFLATGAVLVVLVLGILNLARNPHAPEQAGGGKLPSQTNLSQKLMRWRVILQFAAIVVLMLTLYLAR